MTAPAGPPTQPSPLILLAIRDEVLLRSLESVLEPGGFRIVPAGDPASAAAIVLIRRGYPTRREQLEALRAGAWDLRGDPLDPEDLVLRLGVFVQAKLEVERVGAEGLLDRASGLYNTAGMERRSQELATLSVRQHLPLSCIVFRDGNGEGDGVAAAFKHEGRISDAIGRTGPREFAVFAPATDAAGAARLIKRLGGTVAARAGLARPLKSGFSSSNGAPQIDP